MDASATRFTAADGGARLAAAAATKNVLAVEYSSFIPVRLLYEKAYQIRGSLLDGCERSIYVTRASRVPVLAYELNILTDLNVASADNYEAVYDWTAELDKKEVLISTSEVIKRILEEEVLSMANINVLIIDSCHLIYRDDNLKYIMQLYKQCPEADRPIVLALTYPIFSSIKRENYINKPKNIDENTQNKKDEEPNSKREEQHDKEQNNSNEYVKEIKLNEVRRKEETKQENEIGVYENYDDFDMYEKLEWKIEELEKELCCQMDLAEDIDGGKRIISTSKPRELIIEYCSKQSPDEMCEDYVELEKYMKDIIYDAMEFINDHRHDPTEIYGDELYEEFLSMPDPTDDPKFLFKQFLYVLEQLGPYAADKAALSLLSKLENLKMKIPYERHFILLSLCTTIFVKIRCYADTVFSKYQNEWEVIRLFCTPKVLRFAEILEKFKPPVVKTDINSINPSDITKNEAGICDDGGDNDICKQEGLNTNQSVDKMIKDIDSCDFTSLGNKIQDTVNVIEANLKDIGDIDDKVVESKDINKNVTYQSESQNNIVARQSDISVIEANLKDIRVIDDKVVEDKNINMNVSNQSESQSDITVSQGDIKENATDSKVSERKVFLGFSRRTGHRVRGRSRVQRSIMARALHMQQNPNALCAIVFMKEPLMANIMFMLLVDMSRCNPNLSYLCAQYCANESPADPVTEPKECQRQAKKQEEVLKKFRMHECNLLLATSALEEGIDLPRCNLVLRWDIPPSYRSYGVCRYRARAPRSASALLCACEGTTDRLLQYVATYKELDQIITRKCGCGIQNEPPQTEEDHAEGFTHLIKPYTPNDGLYEEFLKNIKIHNKSIQNQDITHHQSDGLKQINTEKNKIGVEEENHCEITKNHNESDIEAINICQKSYDNKINVFDTKLVDIDETKDVLVIKPNEININQKSDTNEINNEEKNQHIHLNTHVSLANEKNSFKDIDICINEVDTSVDQSDFKDDKCDSDVNRDIECKNVELSVKVLDVKNSENGRVFNISKSEIKRIMNDTDIPASVDLSSAIALINRYCGKLPSDTFTRLTPQWWIEEVQLPTGSGATKPAYICTLRLPLNCPVKYNIVGHPMPTRVLARRMVALQACRILHKSGELDNQLMPIGKENFKGLELETGQNDSQSEPVDANDTARPGTTKRRQYYYKRTAWAFTDCQPIEDTSDSEIDSSNKTEAKPIDTPTGTKRNMLYAIVSSLWCALPERYNTRGRRLHAPQRAQQALGILMARHHPTHLQIPAFPVYTRSGEVRVSVEYVPDADVRLSPRRGRLIRRFMRFVFSEVLRVRRRGMRLQSDATTNNYYIVPTVKTILDDGIAKIDIDWSFLELIYQYTENKKLSDIEKPLVWEIKEGVRKMKNPLLNDGEVFVFDQEKYREAVVTPWYRNQDQPQFFLVAEICWNLTPDSAFPSATHTTFRDYYCNKYGVNLTQADQPLLDVDHTSARLNLLTPRYVNRKGVALPVSSERTRRNKRDRLDQKQILVPELCRVHPFAAPLWFATVALPCVLYRINALLLADEIRRAVAIDVGVGIPEVSDATAPGFTWPALDFGWSLSEVLSADLEKNEKKKEEDDSKREQKEARDKEEEKERQKLNEDVKEKTINDILQEKEDEVGFEIGTWSNDMASSLPETIEYDEYMEPLPPNLTFCTSASGGANWSDPIEKPKFSSFNPSRKFSMADSDCSYMSSELDSDDSDADYQCSDEDTDSSGLSSSKNSNVAMGVRIEYKTAHEAEAVDLEWKKKVNPAPVGDEADDAEDRRIYEEIMKEGNAPTQHIENFRAAVAKHKEEFIKNGLIQHDTEITVILPGTKENIDSKPETVYHTIPELFPYGSSEIVIKNSQVDIESIEKNKRKLLDNLKTTLPKEKVKKMNCFSMRDIDIDSPEYVDEKIVNIGFDTNEIYEEKCRDPKEFPPYYSEGKRQFDFDYQPKLEGHPGPSPSVILQALTMSNANDGINLERLETIGDSFLKFAITAYLYCAHPTVHEGKLSHMRSKQVSNLNLYRLGRNKRLGARMIASKFEPHDNWLPPCHKPPPTLHTRHAEHQEPSNPDVPLDGTGCFIPYNLITQHSIPDKSIADCVEALIGAYLLECGPRGALVFMSWLGIVVLPRHVVPLSDDHPYVRRQVHPTRPSTPPPPTRHRSSSSSSDSSEEEEEPLHHQEMFQETDWSWRGRPVGSLQPYRDENGKWVQAIFGELKAPPSPLLRYIEDPEGELEQMLSGYDSLERTLQYRFKDRSLLLQALTHASHHSNRLTDCYQRLEFLGDAILDYLITRHLYEDPRRHSPGALTDLRSALVNNTIFATLAARHGFHKYFRHMSPGLNDVLSKYVKIQEENGHSISEEHYLIQEDEMEQAEDVEVPKALGDLFESVAGAIFLDSGMSLGAVWKSYVNLMGAELEAFSAAAPKSPVRELLEAEPDTAKFGKPERLADGRRVRVCVEVFGRGTFRGIGRNYRIAKGTAARCALRHLRGYTR